MQGQNFDKNNPAIILCDQCLENMFGMKDLHLSQVQSALAKYLISINKIDIKSSIQPTKIEKSNNRYRLSDHLGELFIAVLWKRLNTEMPQKKAETPQKPEEFFFEEFLNISEGFPNIFETFPQNF